MAPFDADISKNPANGGMAMQSYFIQSGAEQTTLEKREAAVPEPGSGQLLVRMRAAGLNRGEFIAGHGLTKPGAAKPAGGEGAGEIVKLGAGVVGFTPGDASWGAAPAPSPNTR